MSLAHVATEESSPWFLKLLYIFLFSFHGQLSATSASSCANPSYHLPDLLPVQVRKVFNFNSVFQLPSILCSFLLWLSRKTLRITLTSKANVSFCLTRLLIKLNSKLTRLAKPSKLECKRISFMIKKGNKGDSLPVHPGLSSEDH